MVQHAKAEVRHSVLLVGQKNIFDTDEVIALSRFWTAYLYM